MTTQERNPVTSDTAPLIEILAIYICAEKRQPMQSVKKVKAIAGIGLEGDRYASETGSFSGTRRLHDFDRQVTFISRQGIEEANALLTEPDDVPFTEAETRRNIVVNISPTQLNSLVGQEFVSQGITFEGVELCDPCDLPENVRKKKGKFKEPFTGKGGLRARIKNDGELYVRD